MCSSSKFNGSMRIFRVVEMQLFSLLLTQAGPSQCLHTIIQCSPLSYHTNARCRSTRPPYTPMMNAKIRIQLPPKQVATRT
ncbi:hypothetical protein B0H66DRAFT_88699 [Apodospora peruviana]|uniref:Uncharacterized protein n=1 Tax=Apodospora peruviana TaxID=516989 RepID=A0AAE0MGQ7_9PEZI|nr:hypothetical protein B0H66DRAFT_88699 [Apodospora peruviana]